MAGEATDVAVKMHDDYLAKMARRPQPKQHKTHDNKTKNEYGPSKKMGALKKKTSSASNYHRNRMYQKRPSSRQTTRVNTPNRAVPGLVGPFSRMKQLEDMIEELKTAIDKTKAELKETVSQKNEEIAVAKAEAKAQLTAQLDAHNKREAETEQKYKEMLLARDEAILQQKMNSTQRWNDQQVLLTQERNKVKKLDQLVKEQDGKIKYVREELKKEEEEFEQLHEEYNSIQNKLSSSEQKMGELQDTISFQVDEIDRHKVIVRRLDLQLAKAYPPKEDACCSARSYSENDLIGLREDSIATKEAQIEILNKRIAELTDTIDTVEATIPPLKELVDHQEAEIEKLRRANHRQNAQLDRYRRDELEAKGKADAVEVATKQNSQLLLLLQREEANSQKLQVENEDTQAEIKRVKANNLDLTSRLAETEAALKVANALKQDTEEQQKKINKLKRSLRIQKEECEKAINDNNRIAKAEVASITDELQQRRRAHYLQLEKLSSKSQSYQEQKDSNEYLTEQNQILGDRVTELEGLLKQANDSHAQTREAAEQKECQLNATITQLQLDVAMGNQEREKLESDLKELSGEVLKLVKRHKQMEKEQAAASSAKAIQDKEMRALLKRISVLQEEANTHGRLRMTTIAERDDLKQRLDVLQMQMLQERSLSQNFAEQADSDMQRVTKHQREQRTAKELVVQRLVQMACRQRKGRVVLDLSKCFINDALLSTVVTRFREGSMLQNVKMLNLRCNEITDRGARRLAMLFSKCDVLPEEVDLRQNRIDTPGIRALAQAMQRNKIFASAYVYMHLDGRIQAIGNTGKDTQTIGAEEDGDPLPESDPSGEIQSLAVIDVRDNFYAEDTDRGAGPKIKKKKSESTGRTKKFGFSDGNTKPARTFKPKRSVASAYGSSRKPAKVKRSKTAFAKSKPKVEDGEEPPTNPANSNSLSALPALYQTSS